MEDSKIYIIKISSYRESSNLYDAIAKDYGKITFIHKGIKSNTKKSQLELFTSYKVDWSGKGDIKFLRNYEIDSKNFLDKDFYIIGLYFNELIYYLARNDYQIETLYNHYHIHINNLKKEENLLVNLNNFEIGLLRLIGNYIIFDIDVHDNEVEENQKYSYDPEHGPRLNSQSQQIYSGETLLALSGKIPYSEIRLKESRVLMKRLIDYYIRPKKIMTREILKYTNFKY